MIGKYLAIANMCLAIGACIGYLWVQNYRQAIYWGAASILTASVTF